MKYRLGIDLGTSSIGVAAYELNEKNEIKDLIYLDSYIFGEPINPKMSVTLNTDRRSARLARRQIERKAKRLRKMAYIAESIGVTKKDLDTIKDKDVIKLRAEALSHKITLPELIKVFSHIVKNRGYKGNLKALEKLEKQNVEDSETEDNKAQENSKDVSGKIYSTKTILKGRTLGEVLYEKKENAEKNTPWRKLNEEGTFITRDIIEDEFNKIWEEQSKYHKELRNNYKVTYKEMFPDHVGKEEITLKEAFRSAMFYQRPIKWKLTTIGNCILEEDEYRAAIAQPEFQKYRLASNISNLRIKAIGLKGDRSLTSEEINKIYIYVCENFKLYNSRSKIPYNLIYKELGLKDNEKFTIDRAKGDTATEDGLKGITTLQSFYNCDKEDFKFINAFNSLSDKAQEIVIEFLANITNYLDIQENEESYIDKKIDINEKDNLVQNIKNAEEDDYKKAKVFIKMLRKKDIFYNDKFYLEQGRSSYSVKAIKRIIPELLKGDNEQNIIATLYPPKSETQSNSVLRDYKKLITNNPIIDKVLREYQRTINYIIKRFGSNPTEMTIELTRELKNSLAKRKYIEGQNKIAQDERTLAMEELKGHKIFLGGENLEKYLLFKEQDRLCPYCDKEISIDDIVHNTQVDHIIPTSKGGPNIYANKVLAHTRCNHEKGNRIPYEYKFGDDIEEYISFLSNKKSGDSHKSAFGKQSTLINLVQVLWEKYKKESKGYYDKRKRKMTPTEKGKRLRTKINFILIKPDEVESVVEKYSNMHLTSTAWINKIIMDWSKDICPKVTPSYGILTAYLRDKWNYNEILPLVRIKENKKLYDIKGVEIKKKKWEELFTKKDLEFSESEALKEDFKEYINSLPKEEKPLNDTDKQKFFKYFCQNLRQDNKFDKRCDYRHHAIDAAIIGLSTLSLIQQASDHNKKYGGLYGVKNEKGEVTVPHFEIKKEDALLYKRIKERIEEYLTNFIVWHKPDRTPNGKFFEETAYNVKEINGEKRFTIRQTLEKILGKENNCDDFIKKLEEVIVGEEIKKEVIKQLKERLDNGMSLKEAFLEKDIVFRGNIIKKLKVFYKERGFIQFYDGIDVNIVSKYYQNAGYACMDFDKNNGKVKNAIPLWRFNANNLIKDDNVSQDTVRIFINDIVYDKKSKEFYKVTSFQYNEQKKQIVCNLVSDNIKTEKYKEKDTVSDNIKSKQAFGNIKNIILCKNRVDIVKVKKEHGK